MSVPPRSGTGCQYRARAQCQ